MYNDAILHLATLESTITKRSKINRQTWTKIVPYFRTYTPHTHITRTRLYPAQNQIFSTEKFVQPAPSYTLHWSCKGMSSFHPYITHVTAAGGMGEGERGR